MRFLLLSDMHIRSTAPKSRTDDFITVQWDKLKFVLNYAKKHKATILQAGDWHNSKRDFRALSEEIQILIKYDVDIYVVAGQHDQYYRQQNAPSNLSILFHTGLIKRLPVDFSENILVHGCGWGESISEVHHEAMKIKKMKNAPFQILVTHLPIAQEALFSTHKYIDSNDYLKQYPAFDYTLCGDIHQFFLTANHGKVVANTGPMLRDDLDNINHAPCFRALDIEDGKLIFDEVVEIPHAKGDTIFSREHLDQTQRRKDMVEHLHTIDTGETTSSRPTIEQAMDDIITENQIDAEIVDYMYSKIEEGETNG